MEKQQKKYEHEDLHKLLKSLTGESDEVTNESLKNIYRGIALREINVLLEEWDEYTIEEKSLYTKNTIDVYDLHKFLGIMNNIVNGNQHSKNFNINIITENEDE